MQIPIVSSLLSVTASMLLSMLKSMITTNVIRKLIILLGDEIVKRTPNDVDNRVWEILKEGLEKRLRGDDSPIDKEAAVNKLQAS